MKDEISANMIQALMRLHVNSDKPFRLTQQIPNNQASKQSLSQISWLMLLIVQLLLTLKPAEDRRVNKRTASD